MLSNKDDHNLLKQFVCFGYDIPFIDDVIDTFGVQDYQDLYRICGLIYGTGVWPDNMEKLLRNGVISKASIICFREDIFEYLIKAGFDEARAHFFSEKVRRGTSYRLTEDEVAELVVHDVPQWYIDACKKILYLSSRDICEKYCWIVWRLLYINYII